MHEKLRLTRFGDRLEGEYVATSNLCVEEVKGLVARCEKGILAFDVPSELSAENIVDARQNAIVVHGSNPKSVMPFVSHEAVSKVMQDYVKELYEELKRGELEGLMQELTWLSSEVLNICRALYTLKTGKLTSKSAGGRWALNTLPSEWKPLIDRSLAVRYGNEKKNDKLFIATELPRFITYALNCLNMQNRKTDNSVG